jgi:glucan phosphorylase
LKYFGLRLRFRYHFDEFFDLGREVGEQRRELFSMAVLAMRLSTHQNAVSKLHAQVSRRLWRGVTPDLPLSEVPIRPITNGVHPATWTPRRSRAERLPRGRRPGDWVAGLRCAASRRLREAVEE